MSTFWAPVCTHKKKLTLGLAERDFLGPKPESEAEVCNLTSFLASWEIFFFCRGINGL